MRKGAAMSSAVISRPTLRSCMSFQAESGSNAPSDACAKSVDSKSSERMAATFESPPRYCSYCTSSTAVSSAFEYEHADVLSFGYVVCMG